LANGDLSSGNLAFWGSTYSSLPPSSVGSGNRYVFASNSQTVSATVETTNASKTYGSAAINLSSYVSVSASASASGPYLTTASGTYTLADLFSTLPSITSLGNTTTASVSGGPYAITASSGVVKAGFTVTFANNGVLSITPKTITVAGSFSGSKVYDGLTSVVVSGSGTSFGGVINNDVVTLSGITGTFADRHVGTGKSFTVSGLTLGGAGATNYMLDPLSATTGTGNITQLSSVTWSGPAAGGNWSSAANWGNAIPDRGNVALAIIPSGSTAVANADTGYTGKIEIAGTYLPHADIITVRLFE
jgi:hypothetical protein